MHTFTAVGSPALPVAAALPTAGRFLAKRSSQQKNPSPTNSGPCRQIFMLGAEERRVSGLGGGGAATERTAGIAGCGRCRHHLGGAGERPGGGASSKSAITTFQLLLPPCALFGRPPRSAARRTRLLYPCSLARRRMRPHGARWIGSAGPPSLGWWMPEGRREQ